MATVTLQVGSKVVIKPFHPNNGSGNAVDLQHGGAMPGTPILVQAYTRAINQQWIVGQGDQGGYTFQNVQSRTYLGFADGFVKDSVASGQYTPVEFTVARGKNGVNLSILDDPSIVLDYKENAVKPPVTVWLWPRNGTPAQEWTLEFV